MRKTAFCIYKIKKQVQLCNNLPAVRHILNNHSSLQIGNFNPLAILWSNSWFLNG